jgi:hypothetical protein
MRHEQQNIYVLEIRGFLGQAEWKAIEKQLAEEIGRVGDLRLLGVLVGFEGWERGPAWNDLWFFVTYGDRIERIAIVGPERWRDEALMFAGADLRRAPVQFFPDDREADARAWLAEDSADRK